MRNTILILLSLLFFSVGIIAQPVLKRELNAPRAGDRLIKQQVEYKDPGRNGDNVLWDFSYLSSTNNKYSLVYSIPLLINDSIYILGLDTIPTRDVKDGELLVGTEHYTMYYYRFKEDQLLLLGHENPTNLLQYTKPLQSLIYPLAYKKKYMENYTSRGIYSFNRPFSTDGQVEIEADAYGMMILPGDDTLGNVLRVKTAQRFSQTIVTERKDSVIQNTLSENYKWYSIGYRYPVFETVEITVMTDSIETGHFETAFFYPPQDHYYLENDKENLALLENKDNPSPENLWEGMNYNFYPNPVTSDVLNIELYLPRSAQVKLQLRTQVNFLLLNENKGNFPQGLHRLQLNLPMLTTGNYVLTILLDDYPISEIIMKR